MRNWAENVEIGSTRVIRPTSLDGLRKVVSRSRRIRAVGATHSFSGVVDADGEVVLLDRMGGAIEIDPDARTATVDAGATFADVAGPLHRAGLALPNLASLPDISVAGACATGTHGSGDAIRGLAAGVSGLQLVGPDGDLVELRRDVDHDTFAGSVVALGALGIVTRVVLDVEPTYEVAQSVHLGVALDDVQHGFDAVLGAATSVSVFTDFARDAAVWCKQRTDQPGCGLDLGRPAPRPTHPVPGFDPATCTGQGGVPGPWFERLPHFRAGATPPVGDELQSEYFVDRSAAPAVLAAVRDLADVVGPVLEIGEIRTVRGDDLWMSPAHGRDSATFHFTWVHDAARVWPVIEALEQRLGPLGARPHWAKLTAMPTRQVAATLPRAADFRDLVAKTDPDGTFGNPFLDDLLDPTGNDTGPYARS